MRFKRKLNIFTSVSILTGLSAIVFSGSALADEAFTFNTGFGGGDGNVWTYASASGDYTVTATAWSDTAEVNGWDNIENAQLASFGGGLGVRNRNGGNEDASCCEHSMDNVRDYDFILFEFKNVATTLNEAVTLTTVDLGYAPYDSDMTVMAFTNPFASSAVDPAGGLSGENFGTLANSVDSGWTRFDLSNVGLAPTSVGAGTTESSWWIVGARFTTSDKDDKLKLYSIGATIPSGPPTGGVPLPASIFLMIAGLPLIRRFQRARNA
jgi:hypothetical protein